MIDTDKNGVLHFVPKNLLFRDPFVPKKISVIYFTKH